jgi:hypothetical protein
MGDPSAEADEELSDRSHQDEELRTIGFRLREIQRLLAIRVEQENRRLDAEGLDRVSDTGFRDDATEE